MSHRRAGRFGADAQKLSRASFETTFGSLFAASADIISDRALPGDASRRIVHLEMEPQEARAKAAALPGDVLLEPAVPHYPAWTMPLMFRWLGARTTSRSFERGGREPWSMPLAARSDWTMPLESAPLFTMPLRGMLPLGNPLAGSGAAFQLKVVSRSRPLRDVGVTLFLRGSGGVTLPLREQTNNQGVVAFQFSPNLQVLAAVIEPYATYWPLIVRGPVSGQTAHLEPLPEQGPLEWWHQTCGITKTSAAPAGRIRVGVVDTGCGPHPHLAHVNNIGAFVNGASNPVGGADVDRHGTHVTGIIGARPSRTSGFSGMAPNAELFSARVFPNAETGANQGDIAEAIERLSKTHEVDLINLSLGSPVASEILRDAIQDALERGTLCLCAAGNDGTTPISFPARFPECVAVSALGLNGWGFANSFTAANYPNEPDKYGDDNLFLAEFSNFGPEITCGAPGNGIISTVPALRGQDAPYAALDGTSMACPVATGVLARVLGSNPQYQALPRNTLRAAKARQALEASCRDVGLATQYQGRGCPQA